MGKNLLALAIVAVWLGFYGGHDLCDVAFCFKILVRQ